MHDCSEFEAGYFCFSCLVFYGLSCYNEDYEVYEHDVGYESSWEFCENIYGFINDVWEHCSEKEGGEVRCMWLVAFCVWLVAFGLHDVSYCTCDSEVSEEVHVLVFSFWFLSMTYSTWNSGPIGSSIPRYLIIVSFMFSCWKSWFHCVVLL